MQLTDGEAVAAHSEVTERKSSVPEFAEDYGELETSEIGADYFMSFRMYSSFSELCETMFMRHVKHSLPGTLLLIPVEIS